MPEINWTLINDLRTKPHPLVNHDPARFPEHARCDSIGCGEIVGEARTAQHLLDLAGIPRGHGYDSDVDARTYLLLAEVINLRERLDRITGWHSRETGPGGMVGDFCNDCGHVWPCDTRRMAEGIYTDEPDVGTAAGACTCPWDNDYHPASTLGHHVDCPALGPGHAPDDECGRRLPYDMGHRDPLGGAAADGEDILHDHAGYAHRKGERCNHPDRRWVADPVFGSSGEGWWMCPGHAEVAADGEGTDE